MKIISVYLSNVSGVNFFAKNLKLMKRRTFDVIVILLIAIVLTILNQLDLLEKLAGFLFIPLLIMYFIGQYAARKFSK